jgi:voltage-gated potassium channel
MRPLPKNLRDRLAVIIFGTDTPAGRAFDAILIWTIIASVIVVLLESVHPLKSRFDTMLYGVEWLFTGLFTVEYILRVIATRKPWKYIFSFFGLVDLLSILPTYIGLLFPGTQAMGVIRIFRVIRLFRVFKLVRYMKEARILGMALKNSQPKIIVFLTTLSGIVVTLGSLMYLVEGEEHGFTSIPKGIYWAVITLTTVGYGDLVPRTALGQSLATFVMILGYAIIAVPTGIMTVEIAQAAKEIDRGSACHRCGAQGHTSDARYCRVCGESLTPINA